MTLINTSFVGVEVPMPQPIHWKGGPARLYMQRLLNNYRLPEAELANLTSQEQNRLLRSPRADKTHRALAARVQLRKMLGEVLECAPLEVELQTDAEGRPGLHPRYMIPAQKIDFSVSYAPQGFVVAVSQGHRIGADIQKFNQKQKDSFGHIFGGFLARRHQTKMEPQALWTRMEAYGKMQGEGLGYGMQKLYQIALHPERANIPCQFYDIRFGVGTSLCLCLSGSSEVPICLEGS